eukprot:1143124-Pelagomonas_calceolata.AAC.6
MQQLATILLSPPSNIDQTYRLSEAGIAWDKSLRTNLPPRSLIKGKLGTHFQAGKYELRMILKRSSNGALQHKDTPKKSGRIKLHRSSAWIVRGDMLDMEMQTRSNMKATSDSIISDIIQNVVLLFVSCSTRLIKRSTCTKATRPAKTSGLHMGLQQPQPTGPPEPPAWQSCIMSSVG